MSIKGFNIDGNIEKVDYESLENKPFYTNSESLYDVIVPGYVRFAEYSSGIAGYSTSSIAGIITEGVDYKLEVDDCEILCTFERKYMNAQNKLVSGNLSFITNSGYEDNGLDYAIEVCRQNKTFLVVTVYFRNLDNYYCHLRLTYLDDNVILIPHGTYATEEEEL